MAWFYSRAFTLVLLQMQPSLISTSIHTPQCSLVTLAHFLPLILSFLTTQIHFLQGIDNQSQNLIPGALTYRVHWDLFSAKPWLYPCVLSIASYGTVRSHPVCSFIFQLARTRYTTLSPCFLCIKRPESSPAVLPTTHRFPTAFPYTPQ